MSTVRSSTRTSSGQLAHWLAEADHLAGSLHGRDDVLITDVAPLERAGPNDVTYLETLANSGPETAAGCLLTTPEALETLAERLPETALLPCRDPQAAFIAVMLRLRPARSRPQSRISLDAYVAPTARVGQQAHVGANAFIGEEARIGDRTIIHPGVYVGQGVRIGEDCVLHPGAVVLHDCRLGDRVVLHPNAVIGADGFGYRLEADHYERIPHTAGVLIEDDCEIGACATVDRGMIEDTVIGQGTKLDNLVMVAHNCRLGPHNAAAALVGLAGSVTTEAYVRFGGHAGIGGHCTIGQGASIGAKAAVASDVPAGETYHGMPAGPARETLRQMKLVGRLPEMRSQLRDLQKQVERLTAALDCAASHDATTHEPPASRAA